MKHITHAIVSAATLLSVALASVAFAQVSTNTADMADAEVRKIDKDGRKLTLKHGEIKNLEMPPMTMVFKVKDVALLDKVQVGDKIKFSAEKIDGAYTVTDIAAEKK